MPIPPSPTISRTAARPCDGSPHAAVAHEAASRRTFGPAPTLLHGRTSHRLPGRALAHVLRLKAESALSRLADVSPLGWSAAIGGSLCLVVFAATGWQGMLAAGVCCWTLIVGAVLLSLGGIGLSATITPSAYRLTVGDTVTVSADIVNRGRTPTPAVQGELAIGHMTERFRIPVLAPDHSAPVAYAITAHARAVLRIGPLQAARGDPFGMIRRSRMLAAPITVFVHPQTIALPAVEAGAVRDLDGSPAGRIVDDDLDFHGLREYQSGDDRRHIHWLSSSKTGRLMIRQYEDSRRTDTSLTLAVDSDEYADEAEFELAVCVLASIGVQCLTGTRPLHVHAGRHHATVHHAAALLDDCSAITPEPHHEPGLMESALRHDPHASLHCLIIGSHDEPGRIGLLSAALPPSARCLILQVNRRASRRLRRVGDVTFATVTALDDLPPLMEAIT